MAQNDYFVIVYRVLKYLYDCLKKGEKPEAEYLVASTYNIPENYWIYIRIYSRSRNSFYHNDFSDSYHVQTK